MYRLLKSTCICNYLYRNLQGGAEYLKLIVFIVMLIGGCGHFWLLSNVCNVLISNGCVDTFVGGCGHLRLLSKCVFLWQSTGLMKIVLWLLHPDPISRATLRDLNRDRWTQQPVDIDTYSFEVVIRSERGMPAVICAC